MSFYDQLTSLAEKIERSRENVHTEEATKSAFIMPFIATLGYDVFDPSEVIPEYTADHGTKKGEKIDYAIRIDGDVAMLIECKCCTGDLTFNHASQLYRYFGVEDAKIAILTNGIEYQVYTDIDKANKMDTQPFLTFDLLKLTKPLSEEIKRLEKSQFNLKDTIDAAVTLKYTQGIRRVIEEEFSEPSDEMIKMLAKNVYSGKQFRTEKVDEFRPIVKKAISQYFNDKIQMRLAAAAAHDASELQAAQEEENEVDQKAEVVTTEEEHQGYAIVKAVLRKIVAPDRIAVRDTLSYCGVLLDDNNRQPICRLHFNRAQKYLGLFDAEKNEERIPIDTVDDIYKYEARLVETIGFYDTTEDKQVTDLTSSPSSNTEVADTPEQSSQS